jgi:hypothetical protein
VERPAKQLEHLASNEITIAFNNTCIAHAKPFRSDVMEFHYLYRPRRRMGSRNTGWKRRLAGFSKLFLFSNLPKPRLFPTFSFGIDVLLGRLGRQLAGSVL